MTRMSGALRRAPSPQQILDSTSRTVVAGVNALFSIREEDKNAYKDHETWEEEAEARKAALNLGESASGPSRQSLKKHVSQDIGHRKTVAVVISADVDGEILGDGEDYMREHAVYVIWNFIYQAYLGRSLSCRTFRKTQTSHPYASSSLFMRLG